MKVITPVLAFRHYTSDSGKIAKLINWWCGSKYYHVELILENKWISATPDHGIYISKLRPLDHDKYHYVKLPTITVEYEHYNDILSFIEEQVNDQYDMCGLIWNQVIGINIYNSKWFCSELVAYILMLLGYKKIFGKSPSAFGPQDLYDVFGENKDIVLRSYSLTYRLKRVYTRCYNRILSLFYKKSIDERNQ